MNLANIKNLEDLKKAKHEFYEGEIKKLRESIKDASPAEKEQIGKKLSKLKQDAEIAFEKKALELKEIEIQKRIDSEWVDVTRPVNNAGSLHPLTIVANRFRTWFIQNGYYETFGSEIETDEYNFERLNIAKEHPAREMQDSLYITSEKLLRTHNTGFTARELEKNANKAFSQFAIGRVYRNDEDDQTHSHQFNQVDFVSVGYVTIPNLIWTLQEVLSYVLEEEIKVRMRPSYFPFTEPSLEVDMFYKNRWVEVLGAGMLNEQVLKSANYTNDMNGFAAGIGIERIAMIKFGISDIREFYKNDLRFLNQFKR